MPYRLPPMQNQLPFHNMVSPVNQGNALRGVRPDLSTGTSPRNYVGSGYPAVPNLQYPAAFSGGVTNNRPLNSSPASVPSTVTTSPSGTSPGGGSSSGGQVEGS